MSSGVLVLVAPEANPPPEIIFDVGPNGSLWREDVSAEFAELQNLVSSALSSDHDGCIYDIDDESDDDRSPSWEVPNDAVFPNFIRNRLN